jgi:hypothetical protein
MDTASKNYKMSKTLLEPIFLKLSLSSNDFVLITNLALATTATACTASRLIRHGIEYQIEVQVKGCII